MSDGELGVKPGGGEVCGGERGFDSGEGPDKVFGHFLQSEDWEKYEQAEGHETRRVSGEGFRAMVAVHETAMGRYLFCPYGPELWKVEGHDLKWSLEQALNSLSQLAKKEKAFFVRVEPTVGFSEAEMTGMGLVRSHDLDPAHTWVMDLTSGQESLLGGMEKRKVRYWRNYQKRGFSMRQSKNPEEIGLLTSLLKALGDRDNFNPQDETHLKRQLMAGFATLYILEAPADFGVAGEDGSAGVRSAAGPVNVVSGSAGEVSVGASGVGSVAEKSGIGAGGEKKVIAAALIYDYDGVRYYAHAAADEKFMKYAPGSIVLIQMIMDACLAGMRVFDFWGMTTSEDPKHPWYGFTQYKKSFGGRQVDYAGTWDLPVDKAKYRLYQGVRAVNRVMRKKR